MYAFAYTILFWIKCFVTIPHFWVYSLIALMLFIIWDISKKWKIARAERISISRKNK